MGKLKSLSVIAAVSLAIVSTSVPSDAALVGANCVGGKLKAAGKRAQSKLNCHKVGAKKGIATDSLCLTNVENRYATSWSKAEGKPPCYVTGDAGAIATKVDAFVSAMVADLRPALTKSNCAGGQLSAAGKKAGAKMTCHQKAAKKGLAVDPLCMTKAEDKFDDRFADAVALGDCLSGSTAATIEAAVDVFVADVADDIRPGPLSHCTGRKAERTGQKQLDKLRCHSKAAKDGATVDSTCLTEAETKFDDGFTQAETHLDCMMPTGDAAAIEAKVDVFVGDVETALRLAMTPSKCVSNKLNEAGREANRKLTCRGRSINTGLPFSGSCLLPADVVDPFAKYDTLPDCQTTGDAAAVGTMVDTFVDDVFDDLTGTTTTTSTTTTTL